MVLLILHYDQNDVSPSPFYDTDVRLDFGFFPKQNTRMKLKSVGYNVNSEGGTVYLGFPDVLSHSLSNVELDLTEVWETPGFRFSTEVGQKSGLEGRARYVQSSNNIDLDIDLGFVDTQKDYFTIKVNGRRAVEGGGALNALNNITIVLEMVMAHEST